MAIIELDDQSHDRPDRQLADGRKTKTLADAGLRPVRIPTVPLPSDEQLSGIIGAEDTFVNL